MWALWLFLRFDRGLTGYSEAPSDAWRASPAPSAYSAGSDGKRRTNAIRSRQNPPPLHARSDSPRGPQLFRGASKSPEKHPSRFFRALALLEAAGFRFRAPDTGGNSESLREEVCCPEARTVPLP